MIFCLCRSIHKPFLLANPQNNHSSNIKTMIFRPKNTSTFFTHAMVPNWKNSWVPFWINGKHLAICWLPNQRQHCWTGKLILFPYRTTRNLLDPVNYHWIFLGSKPIGFHFPIKTLAHSSQAKTNSKSTGSLCSPSCDHNFIANLRYAAQTIGSKNIIRSRSPVEVETPKSKKQTTLYN